MVARTSIHFWGSALQCQTRLKDTRLATSPQGMAAPLGGSLGDHRAPSEEYPDEVSGKRGYRMKTIATTVLICGLALSAFGTADCTE